MTALLVLFAFLVVAAVLSTTRLGYAMLAVVDDVFERLPSRRAQESALAGALVTPAVLILGVFGLAPLLYALYISRYNMRGPTPVGVGFGHYQEALTSSDFWHSFLVTLYFAVGTIPVTLALSFLVASALFRITRGRGLFRTLYFLPYVTSAVAAAIVWRAMLHPRIGVVNTLLAACGFDLGALPQWLLEPRGVLTLLTDGLIPPGIGPSLALCCVILFEIWHSSGFMIVIFLAGLSTIPREMEEAAAIDGAGWWRVTRHVTLPLLSPTIFFLTVVSVIKAFQSFNAFYALTGNGRGPIDTTQNMTIYIYSNFYEYGRLGYGAAVATLLSIAIVVLTIVQWRYAGRKVHYE
jgi:multiple sugar transport system permease protein